MFEYLFNSANTIAQHRDGPFAEDRKRFLEHCRKEGFSKFTLCKYASRLLSVAGELDASPGRRMTLSQIRAAANRWARVKYQLGIRRDRNRQIKHEFIQTAVNWFRFLGRFKETPNAPSSFSQFVEDFKICMEDEYGLAKWTIINRLMAARRFLQWYSTLGRSFSKVRLTDVDAFMTKCAERGWSRVTTANEAGMLRAFFRHAGRRGWCNPAIADGIKGPRLYAHENLPVGPSWKDVKRLFASLSTDNPSHIRDLPMLMLCAIYGLRPSEVARLRLEDIDWEHDQVLVRRSKVNKAQVYPLIPQVGNAILRYLKEVRPKSVQREVFLTRTAPIRPVTTHILTRAAREPMLALGIHSAKLGAYALRHACATHLASQGISFKVIGDHLGHVSPNSTRIYAKVDLPMLRKVAMLDLGGVR